MNMQALDQVRSLVSPHVIQDAFAGVGVSENRQTSASGNYLRHCKRIFLNDSIYISVLGWRESHFAEQTFYVLRRTGGFKYGNDMDAFTAVRLRVK